MNKPEEWTDVQVLDFLSAALRHVSVEGELHMQDVRDGFRYMREKYGTEHAPAEADRRDAERMEFVLRSIPGDALRYAVGELADTAGLGEFRAAIDAAMAQGGSAELSGNSGTLEIHSRTAKCTCPIGDGSLSWPCPTHGDSL